MRKKLKNVQRFKLKEGKYETLLIIDEDTDYQTYIRMDDTRKSLLKAFLKRSYQTNQPGKKLSQSCVTGVDSEKTVVKKDAANTLKAEFYLINARKRVVKLASGVNADQFPLKELEDVLKRII